MRYNKDVVLVSSAARTATFSTPDLENIDARGVRIHLAISAVSGTTPTLVVKAQAKDPASGLYNDIVGAAFASKNATGQDMLVIVPGIAASANKAVSDALPRTWRLVCTIAGTSPSFTFTVGAQYIG